MFDDINTKGYGLPYLGIKPTAIGVAPIPPPSPMMQQMMMNTPVPPVPSAAPSMKAPVAPAAPKPTAKLANPLPISNPQSQMNTQFDFNKTTQTADGNKPQITGPVNPAQVTPSAPQIYGPLAPPVNTYQVSSIPMGGIENYDNTLPMSLQPKAEPFPAPKPGFNQLSNLLNKGTQK
jgi:hypothetical protein